MVKDEGLNSRPDVVSNSDLEDDEIIQDWSQAATLSIRSSTLPKSGEKDYEPDGTNTQELLLYRARKAMFETLSHSPRGTVLKNQVKAYYDPEVHRALIFQPKGNFLQTMGKSQRDATVWLEFHEFLYLAERGTVTPFYMMKEIDWRIHELPLSIEDLYLLFKSRQELDHFFVYAHLKRLGFIVTPCRSQIDSFYAPQERSNKLTFSLRDCHIFLHWRRSLHNMIFLNPWSFCVIKYISTPQIYQSLNQLVPFYRAPKTEQDLRSRGPMFRETSNLTISLNVWKPRADFKKKNPGLPDYQVVVYNKNDCEQHFPTYSDFRGIFNSLDYKFEFLSEIDNWNWDEHSYHDGKLRSEILANTKPKDSPKCGSEKKPQKMRPRKKNKSRSPRAMQKNRLKHGYRSFLLAVMDDGVISFVRISESDFGSENVWYTPNTTKYNHQN